MRPSCLRAVAQLLLVLFVGLGVQTSAQTSTQASTQAWSVQSVALGDYQEALARQQQLTGLGYDAYVDFGMSGGRQFARVRVGCFTSRDAAQTFASELEGWVTAEAVPVPLEPSGTPRFCLDREVGFAPPGAWAQQLEDGGSVAFWVDLGGARRFVVYGSAGWRVAQTEAELGPLVTGASAAPRSALFSEAFLSGAARVTLRWGSSDFVVATGTLLWQRNYTALVLEDGVVVAYRISAGVP